MATPIGHSLLGLVFSLFAPRQTATPVWPWFLFVILAANAPDLDFLLGFFYGDANRFHQGASHSLASGVLFGLLTLPFARFFGVSRLRVGILAFIIYSSHLILDLFVEDLRAPYGIPLFWPFLTDHFQFPWPFFQGVKHGVPGDSLTEVVRSIFSWHNLMTIALEVLIVLPLFMVAFYLTKIPTQSKINNHAMSKLHNTISNTNIRRHHFGYLYVPFLITTLFILLFLIMIQVFGPSYISAKPPTAPYSKSSVIEEITFDMSTYKRLAPGSDNWPITWADDDHQYTTWGDGGGFGGTNKNGRVSLGVGRVEGIKDNYEGINIWGGFKSENPSRFSGKSYGVISINGILYMWRCGAGSNDSAFDFNQLYASSDQGTNWEFTNVEFKRENFQKLKGFFCPTFLQFGKDYNGARDHYIYIYAPENKDDLWEVQKPGEITLMRVPTQEITDQSKFQFFGGLDDFGDPIWTGNIVDRKPVFRDTENGVMRTSVSYNRGLSRYILVTQQTSRFRSNGGRIGIYDAPEPWGPWTTVLFADPWMIGLQTGEKTVFWNFSNKWLSDNGENFVLVYTGKGNDSWGTVEGKFQKWQR